jgi:phospholipid/cholesterol/gamma-HCH transport system substrate-binding protein
VTTRLVKFQLVAFVLVSVVGIVYLGGSYIRVDRMAGRGVHTVHLQLADSGGIFSNAEVSYRGVTVGRVGELRLIPDGVEVDLVLDDSGPRIPADLRAQVANRSAVGEQYVDLLPNTDHGPFLRDGSVIPRDHTATPLPVETVLLNLDQLVTSIPLDRLRVVVDELYAAFDGTGPQLQQLLDATSLLVRTADENLPQTLDLLRDGRTVLATVNDQASAIRSFSGDLRLLSEQLNASDADIRHLVAAGPLISDELSALIRDAGPGLGDLMADLLVINTEVLLPRQDSIRVPLFTYPIVVASGYTVLPGDGTAHLTLGLNIFDPPPCMDGYQATEKRTPYQTWRAPLNININCAEPLGSPVGVRAVKYGYPYVNGQPNFQVPPWVCAKYGDNLPGAYATLCDDDRPGGPDLGGSGPGSPGGAAHALQAGPGLSDSGLSDSGLPGFPGMPDGGGAIELLASLLGGE